MHTHFFPFMCPHNNPKIANPNESMIQSIPDGQNKAPSYIFSYSRGHFTQIYIGRKSIATSVSF